MRIIIVGITRRSQLSGRERTVYAYEILGVAVRPQTAIEEEAAIGAYDVALMEAAIVHHHVRCHAFNLYRRGRFFLDPPMVLGTWATAHCVHRRQNKKTASRR